MDEWRNKLKKQQQEAPPSSFLTESPAPPSTSPPSLVGVTTTAAAAALDSAVHSAIKGLNNAMLTVIAGGGGADDATSATTVKSPPCSSSSSSSPLPPSQPQPLEANVVGSFPTTTTTTTSSGSTLKNEQTQQSPFDLAYSYLQSSISSSSSAPAVNWNELATAFQLPATLLDNVDNKLLRPVALFIYPLLKPVLATLTDPASQRRAFNRILLSISLSVLFILAACFYAAFFNLYLPSGERSAQIYLNYGSGNGGGGGFYGLHGFHNNGGGYQHHHHQQKSVTASLPAPFGRLDIYQPLSDELTTRPHSPTASHQQHQIKNHGNHNYQHDSSAFFEEEESNRV